MRPFPSTPVQLSARAMIRAVVVLPTPRTPDNMYAWAIRPTRNAFDKVRTSASWPMSEPKVAGRYFRRVPGSSSPPGRTFAGSELAICTAGERLRGTWRAAKRETEATTRAETRYGCFLPDLTGLARDPSAVSPEWNYISPRPGEARDLIRPLMCVAEPSALCQGSVMDMRLAYSGCTAGLATHLRPDEVTLGEYLRQRSTRILPVWRDRSLIASGSRPRLCSVNGATGEAAISLAPEVVFLGLDESGHAWFACDLSHIEEDQLPQWASARRSTTWGVWSP